VWGDPHSHPDIAPHLSRISYRSAVMSDGIKIGIGLIAILAAICFIAVMLLL
jgi:hypothetical protein